MLDSMACWPVMGLMSVRSDMEWQTQYAYSDSIIKDGYGHIVDVRWNV